MSTLTRHFVWYHHPDTGDEGWIPANTTRNDLFTPGTGLTVAHDLLEHPRMDMTMEDEMLAHGAMWFIRCEQNRLVNYGRQQYRMNTDVIGSTMAEVLRENDYRDLEPCRRVRSYHLSELDANEEEILRLFVKYAESEGRSDSVYEVSEDRTEEDVAQFRRYVTAWGDTAMNWIRRGYLQAKRRWSPRGSLATGYPAHEACDLFWELVEDLDKNHASAEDSWAGGYRERMAIHVNIRRRSYNIVRSTAS